MRVVHITAGAGGRLCGSCLHDNTLVRALRARGNDAMLLPAYVPTTTDEENIAERRIVMGGVNIWLQQHIPLFRHTPWFLDRFLDSQWLLTWLSSRTGETRPADLGPLTISSLEGEHGRHRKEVEKLASLLADRLRPDVVHLSNVLLLGMARRIRQATGAAIVCSLSGEDIFIERIPEPHRSRIHGLLRERADDVDRFVALNHFYADLMADALAVPHDRIAVVPHGIDPAGFPASPPDMAARRRGRGGRFVVGSLARACPETGLDQIIRALPMIRERHDVELRAAGAEVDAERPYVASCLGLARDLGVGDHVTWLGQVDRPGKLALLESIDVFAMPTLFPEAKGIPVIEAMGAGVPVVAPAHGTFPELLDDERAGLVHAPGDPADLARTIIAILDDVVLAARMGRHGHALVHRRHRADQMAAGHEEVYRQAAPRT
ncbi:MAG: glycosyltransferase family 4 protein [Planctomycetia bacterium]